MQGRTTTKLPSNELTKTERIILEILHQTGADNAEIAQQLVCSVRTVTTHFVNISTKLEINSRCKLMVYWRNNRPTD